MRSKTTFLVYCLVGVILLSSACLLVFVRAADQSPSNCESLLEDYREKTDAFNTASATLARAIVAAAKYRGEDIPPDMESYEDEYDSNHTDFMKNLSTGLSMHPRSSGIVNLLSDVITTATLSEVGGAALSAYSSAKSDQKAAEIALEDCQGQSIVTIWCERGADCQLPPGMQDNPRVHKVYDCPEEVEGFLNINVGCPGVYWKCAGENACPRSSDHCVACKGNCGHMVDPDRVDSYHQIICETNEAIIGCGKTYSICSKSEVQAHIGVDRCPQAPNSYHDCGTHETTVSGNHELAGCGTSGHYQCDNREHVLFTCPTNPANQDQNCEYGTYYSCSPHDHSYPSVDNTPNCSSCTDGCSSCLVTCAVGHTYDPSVAYDVNQHRTRTCSLDTCVQTWQNCVSSAPICDDPSRNSQNQNCLEEEW